MVFDRKGDEKILQARLEFLHGTTKMAVRRLNVTRTPDMLKNLDLFIQAMRGRHYKKRVGVLVKVKQRRREKEEEFFKKLLGGCE
jgi:hypothetical protein